MSTIPTEPHLTDELAPYRSPDALFIRCIRWYLTRPLWQPLMLTQVLVGLIIVMLLLRIFVLGW